MFLLDKYPEHLIDLPHISEYRNSAEQAYVRKSLRAKVLTEDDFGPVDTAKKVVSN